MIPIVESATTQTSSGTERTCPGWFTYGQCEHGHRFIKEIYCGKEWCPICGRQGSVSHNRRIARWLPKVQQLNGYGYIVATIPPELRDNYRTKKALNDLTMRFTSGNKSKHIPGVLSELGFDKGLARWHFFGDKSTTWNPHLNIIISAQKIPKHLLDEIKHAWYQLLGTDKAILNYSYRKTRRQMFHSLKYITRATFLNYEWSPRQAMELYKFRNNRTWGKWEDKPQWHLVNDNKGFEITAKFEKGICPICHTPITWHPVLDITLLLNSNHKLKTIAPGYHLIDSS